MRNKTVLLILMLSLTLAAGAKRYIPLVKSVPTGAGGGGSAKAPVRTSVYSPMAFYEDNILYVQFPASTVSSVIITNDSTDLAVINKNFEIESTGIQIDIASLLLYNSYNLYVNAFGNWWVGYFDYELSSDEQSIQKAFFSLSEDAGKERNYGVYSVAGNASSGWNFGVSGILSGQQGGTGIYGSSSYDEGFNTGGKYAGLFHGDLKATDAVYASVYNTLADSRLNQEMELVDESSLDNMMQINVYRYNLKQFNVDGGEESDPQSYYNDDSGILQNDHFGLTGQEIKEIYPNLVTENQEGYYSINYVEMIPLLIQSIQELKKELDETNKELEALKTTTKVAGRTSPGKAVLLQNTPNPFRERSIIKCVIPQSVAYASLYLYDYNGHQIQSRSISDRGDVQIIVESNGLIPGIYLYSLVTDGEIIDTKRMILAE